MNQEEILKTSRLAQLHLSEEEKTAFTSQLKVIFEYFNRISKLNTKGVKPLTYPLEGVCPLESGRKDKVAVSHNQEELLSLAPERLGNEYKTPPVIE